MKILLESTKLPSKIRQQANKLINKYNGLHEPGYVRHMYEELELLGIEIGIMQNRDFQTGNTDAIADVYYNGEIVNNSKFRYQVYEDYFDSNGKYEFNMYLS